MLFPHGALAQSAPPDPMSLRTRDAHQDLTIVADPYLRAVRYTKELFGKDSFYNAGIIAIDVYFKNDNDLPIRLNTATIQLVISQPDQDRQRLGAAVSRRGGRPHALDGKLQYSRAPPVSVPRPFTKSPGHGKDWMEMTATLRSVALGTDVLPPHATTHGFLFFDLNHDFDAIRYSHLYIPDLSFMTNNKALFFFEIDLAEARSR